MGKYFDNKQLLLKNDYNNKHYFKVSVNIHGKRHTEYYSINIGDLESAINLGLFNFNDNGYVDYLDWKPIKNTNNLVGGVKEVLGYYNDVKYIYAITDDNIYSLPRYLENKIKGNDFILFGKRENYIPLHSPSVSPLISSPVQSSLEASKVMGFGNKIRNWFSNVLDKFKWTFKNVAGSIKRLKK